MPVQTGRSICKMRQTRAVLNEEKERRVGSGDIISIIVAGVAGGLAAYGFQILNKKKNEDDDNET